MRVKTYPMVDLYQNQVIGFSIRGESNRHHMLATKHALKHWEDVTQNIRILNLDFV